MKNVLALLTALTMLLLARPLEAQQVCRADALPTIDDVEQVLLKGIDLSLARLVGLVKTDGQLADVFGVKMYSLHYETQIEFVDSAFIMPMELQLAQLRGEWSFAIRKPGAFMFAANHRAGERIEFAGSVSFERSERGWRTGGTVYCGWPTEPRTSMPANVDTGVSSLVKEATPGSPTAQSVAGAVLSGPPAPDTTATAVRASLSAANAAYEAKRWDEAVSLYRPAAERGDAEAQFKLGTLYRMGAGVAKDLSIALEWLTKAANAGNADAAYNLGLLYEQGAAGQIKTDEASAKHWYERAFEGYMTLARNGDLAAGTQIGWMYRQGRGVTQDYGQAIEWLTKGAEKGQAAAQRFLGDSYVYGIGVKKDRAEGVRLLRLAARQGDITAQGMLRRLGESW